MFNDDLKKYLDWLDEQIKLTLREDKVTVMSFYCDIKTHTWARNMELEDVICYELVEAFSVMDERSVIKEFSIYWNTYPGDEVLSDLLLVIPIQYICMMLSFTKNTEKPKPKK